MAVGSPPSSEFLVVSGPFMVVLFANHLSHKFFTSLNDHISAPALSDNKLFIPIRCGSCAAKGSLTTISSPSFAYLTSTTSSVVSPKAGMPKPNGEMCSQAVCSNVSPWPDSSTILLNMLSSTNARPPLL